ncbi:tryptophan-rich sensory protein [Gracilibacillus caseinilyticus]|uniref:Tryptophan-rich sensory protein n=1 Tax=Gracilibacillus caseinilyticus TaxID=2932256 RepID=A0ABY4F0G6_9BACI|nr:TspO/MBR family protein [Gracilibacillus caseinilyticus]UOQ49984.1 tryptophan-rich sensory protein [Gracilibacillus caseinilyticus]
MRNFWINLTALSLVVVINALANIIPINGMTTGEISNQLTVLFTPAGYVFSIWGLIYLLLAIWVFAQLPKNRRYAPIYQACSELFWISSILNVGWLLSWHYQIFWLSTILMIGLLTILIVLYLRAKQVKNSTFDILPFSIYLGWISVATIANISYYLVYIGWDQHAVFWTMVMIIVATLLALFFLWNQKDIFYVLVFIWAFIGIGVKNQADYMNVAVTAYACAFILLIVTTIYSMKRGIQIGGNN